MKGVEPWVSGCWRRESIVFADGTVDRETTVYWTQSGRYCGDIRVPVPRPDRACVQASLSQCHMTGDSAVWDREIAFHPKRHFPEPGLLSLEGDIMIERAPSGAYVERWIRQPGSEGVRAAYALDGHRNGRLVVAGDHLFLAIDRARPLDGDLTLQELLAQGVDSRTLFDCDFTYSRRCRADAPFTIVCSTDPAREGLAVPAFSDAKFIADEIYQGAQHWRRLYDGRD